MASKAKKVRAQTGYNSAPPKKKGRKLPEETLKIVREFYLSEQISRMKSGMNDCISVETESGKENLQKQLLLYNIEDVYKLFKQQFPDVKISQSKFAKLRPKQCLPADKSGSHNVCVCKTHQNMRLKLSGIRKAFSKKGVCFNSTYHTAIKEIICEEPSPSCHFSNCSKCPGAKYFCKKVHDLFVDHSITKVIYMEWVSTDR